MEGVAVCRRHGIESLMVDLDEEFGAVIADRLDDISLGQIVEPAGNLNRQHQREGPKPPCVGD